MLQIIYADRAEVMLTGGIYSTCQLLSRLKAVVMMSTQVVFVAKF